MTRTLTRQYLVRKQEKLPNHENGSNLHNATTENFSWMERQEAQTLNSLILKVTLQ